jgi:hypothetical protein
MRKCAKDAPLGAGPEFILPIAVVDSRFAMTGAPDRPLTLF